jgi:cysteine desulfurase
MMIVYLDNLATTPVDPRVIEAMLPYFTLHFGNASSRTHAFGWKAAEALEEGRGRVAELIGARAPQEIVLLSGATEANNLAIKGIAEFYRDRGNHIVTCVTEHKAVLDCCRSLERRGFQVTYLPVDGNGQLDVEQLRESLTARTVLISIMAANNEIGTIQPLAEIGALARERGILWHCDGAQAVGKIPLDVEQLGIDVLSISGHKLYAPKGVGALYVRSRNPRVRLQLQIEGGGQERGLRSGTHNIPGIVGLGMACLLCQQEMGEEESRLRKLRERLQQKLADRLRGLRFNGHSQDRLPGCLHVSFEGIDGSRLANAFRDLALSAGSACTSGSGALSHVLEAIGLSAELAQASLRFGIGRFNTAAEIDYTVERVQSQVMQLRRF